MAACQFTLLQLAERGPGGTIASKQCAGALHRLRRQNG
jgi:hypothetical protein